MCTGTDCFYGNVKAYTSGTPVTPASGSCGMCVLIQTDYNGNQNYTFYADESKHLETAAAFALTAGFVSLLI